MGILTVRSVSILESPFQRVVNSQIKNTTSCVRIQTRFGFDHLDIMVPTGGTVIVNDNHVRICGCFLLFASWNQFVGASSTSFLSENGLNALSNSDRAVDAGGGTLDEDAGVVEGLGFPKKLAIIDLAFSWDSLSFLSFSAFATFLSVRSFSFN